MKSVIFDTSALHPRDRFTGWCDAVNGSFVRLRPERTTREIFSGALQSHLLGDFLVGRVTAAPQRVRRHAHDIGSGSGIAFINLQVQGSSITRQGGRSALMRPGDLVLLDAGEPFEMEFEESFAQISVKFDRRDLGDSLGDIAELTAIAAPGRSAYGALAGTAIQAIFCYAGGLTSAELNTRMKTNVIELLGIAFEEVRPTARAGRAATSLRQAVVAHVARRLADPELDLKSTASSLAVSPRYIQAALAPAGMSFRRLVREQRLEMCRRALAAGRRNRRIGDIAACWGFLDQAAFSRAFRRAYGCTPSQYAAER
jgi:AraC-like DNA-binding protein